MFFARHGAVLSWYSPTFGRHGCGIRPRSPDMGRYCCGTTTVVPAQGFGRQWLQRQLQQLQRQLPQAAAQPAAAAARRAVSWQRRGDADQCGRPRPRPLAGAEKRRRVWRLAAHVRRPGMLALAGGAGGGRWLTWSGIGLGGQGCWHLPHHAAAAAGLAPKRQRPTAPHPGGRPRGNAAAPRAGAKLRKMSTVQTERQRPSARIVDCRASLGWPDNALPAEPCFE